MAIRLLDVDEAETLRLLINADGEFRLVSRDIHLNLVLQVGGQSRLFRFADGELKAIRPFVPLTETVDVYIKGNDDFWEKLLAHKPPPRFQNLYAGVRFKTCEVTGDSELYFAYFAALTRMVELMRDHENQQAHV